MRVGGIEENDLWYKNGVIYAIDVATFADGNDDGIGDFAGMSAHLDYLVNLGVTCLWLLPFYPSPFRDNGYDVKDYLNVDPRYGTLADFVEFRRQATSRGIRVLIDFVPHHTSDEHPWFQTAKRDAESPLHDYYYWSKEVPANPGTPSFPGAEDGTWEYAKDVDAYYRHLFYEFEPDLNLGNPAVKEEILKIMGFWLQLGVAGFRFDAANHLLEESDLKVHDRKAQHKLLRELSAFMRSRRGDAIFLAEADDSVEHLAGYFDDGVELQMLFNFLLSANLFLALANEDASPVKHVLDQMADMDLPPPAQWANFLRNLDELNLGRLSKAERERVFDAFAPDERMRVYDRGIRRRLAPMLGGDRNRIELAYSLLLTMPGTPVIIYGDEIGMGEDLQLQERWSVRTPMQWSDRPNGGFSKAPAEKLIEPVISGGEYGYQTLNVVAEQRDPRSLLHWLERAIRQRKLAPEFGSGSFDVMKTGDEAVLAVRYDWDTGTIVAVHNLSPDSRSVRLDLRSDCDDPWTDVFANRDYDAFDGRNEKADLDGYGYRWLRQGGPRV